MIFFMKNFIFLVDMFDCADFLKRMGWVQKDLAQKLECSKSTVAMWSNGSNSPPYSAIIKLIDLGITMEELLGREYADKLLQNSVPTKSPLSRVLPLPEVMNNPEFKEGLEEIVEGILKKKGVI